MTNLTETGFGYTDGDVDQNIHNTGPTLNELADLRYSRRQTLQRGGTAIVAATMGGSVLAACDSNNVDTPPAGPTISAGSAATTNAGRTVTLTGTGTAEAYAWTRSPARP